MSSPQSDVPDGQGGFVIDEVPGSGTDPDYTWTLLDRRGDVLARAPQAYPTVEEAQIAIAEVQLYAPDADIPHKGNALIG